MRRPALAGLLFLGTAVLIMTVDAQPPGGGDGKGHPPGALRPATCSRPASARSCRSHRSKSSRRRP